MGKLGHADVVHLLLQLSIMLLVGRLFAEVMRRLKQPGVIGEIIAGVLLGPTVLGMVKPEWFEALYPAGSVSGVVLSGFVQVAVVMLLFVAGLEVDLHIVWQQGRQGYCDQPVWSDHTLCYWFCLPLFFSRVFWNGGCERKVDVCAVYGYSNGYHGLTGYCENIDGLKPV